LGVGGCAVHPLFLYLHDSIRGLAIAQETCMNDPHDQASSHLAAIVESSEDAIVSKNLDGIILTWNAGAERIYGYTAAEAIGRPMTMLLPPDRPTEEADILARLRRGERVSHFETTRVRKDGALINVSLTISPVRGSDGCILGASHVARDITERKRFEQQLRQSQRLESLGVLAGGIAHDFNNLLTGILANVTLASELLPPGSPAQPMLRDGSVAAQRLSDLTRQLLAYSGHGSLSTAAVNISDLVREISALIQTSIPKHVDIRLELEEKPPLVTADASQVQQIIMNLIINGAEAIPPEQLGSVLVKTGYQQVDEDYIQSTDFASDTVQPGGYVSLEVHDTGKGMDAETQTRIFDPFFTTKMEGRGLGLAAVLGIVRSHKGFIRVQSQPGAGTNFRVLLPADANARLRPPVLRDDLRGTGSILVVEDEDVIRRAAKTTLEFYGYTVMLAEDGEQACRILEQRLLEIDAVLLDLVMPKMGGESVWRTLHRIRGDIPVVLTSGYSDADAQARFTGKATAGFLRKPFTAAALGQAIKKALQGRGQPS
jgi:PAS domain S-box-containing protein